MIQDAEFLDAVVALRDEWPALLSEDAGTLALLLAEAAPGDPESQRRTANQVLELLQAHPRAKDRVIADLGIEGDLDHLLRSYAPPPGEPGEVPATVWMVCPVDPSHYRRKLRRRGQKLYCPEHEGVQLVRADSLPPKARSE